MRRVAAVFDAPIPARSAITTLMTSGVAPADIWVMPALPSGAEPGPRPLAPRPEPAALRAALAERDLPPGLADVYVEAVGRGAILLLVETPTIAADGVAELLDMCGAADLATLVARWRTEPRTTYGWSTAEPPQLDPPATTWTALDPSA